MVGFAINRTFHIHIPIFRYCHQKNLHHIYIFCFRSSNLFVRFSSFYASLSTLNFNDTSLYFSFATLFVSFQIFSLILTTFCHRIITLNFVLSKNLRHIYFFYFRSSNLSSRFSSFYTNLSTLNFNDTSLYFPFATLFVSFQIFSLILTTFCHRIITLNFVLSKNLRHIYFFYFRSSNLSSRFSSFYTSLSTFNFRYKTLYFLLL